MCDGTGDGLCRRPKRSRLPSGPDPVGRDQEADAFKLSLTKVFPKMEAPAS